MAAPAFAAPTDGGTGGFGIPSQQPATGAEPPVDLEADSLIHDEGTQIVTAKGNVELVQGGRIVKADAVSYNLRTDQVRATGNVVMSEEDGTTYFADDVELTQDMKNGFVKSLLVLLNDGSRFTAQEGTRTGGTVLVLKQASYTPCEMCKEDPKKPPIWQLRAAKVTHDEAEKRITYRDAWFEFMGVPLAYTPYFSHPDGSEKQKTGFLTPSVGFDSQLGAAYHQEYYWGISPNKDATIGVMAATEVNPVVTGQYRQRFEDASMELGGSVTSSDRYDSIGGRNIYVDEEVRGHLEGTGRWDINEKWRSGYEIAVTSDDQYMRQYNFGSEDVLENELYLERFEGRDYAVARAMAFQDIRISNRNVDQPAVLPEVAASFYGDPNGTLGGRWSADVTALGLYRDGNGQDMGRGTAELGWQRRYITGWGLVNKFDIMGRADLYQVSDRNFAGIADDSGTYSRAFANANLQTSYPFVKRFTSSQWVVEPTVAVTTATNVDFDNDIPNEDSQAIALDSTNLFEANRFPGYDLIEDRSHATYGLRTGLHTDSGYKGEVFFGQSYRFDSNNNPFPVGSGLSEQESDYVGQVVLSSPWLNVDYRFQLENENMSSQRHDVESYFNWDRLALGTRYFYARGIEGTDLNEAREQIVQSARFRVYDEWYLNGSVWYDMGQNEGLRQAVYGIDYIGQCLTASLSAVRTLTDDATGDSENEIMLRVGLKNLGVFESAVGSFGGGGD